MAQDHCPRCENLVEHSATRCPSCDLELHYKDDSPPVSGEKGSSFFGLPQFLRKETYDSTSPNVSLHRPAWLTWLSILVAGLLIASYRTPILHFWNRIIGRSSEVVSVKSLPASDREILISPKGATAAKVPLLKNASLTPAQWIFSGSVYDLITMKPVPKTTLVFEDVGLSQRFKTASKKDGQFRIEIPESSTDGYYLKVRHRGYAPRALMKDSHEIPELMALSVSKRRKLGRDFIRTIKKPNLISPANNAESLNLFLVPISPS